ncbi:unnamed protein product [Calypogeia fissa]
MMRKVLRRKRRRIWGAGLQIIQMVSFAGGRGELFWERNRTKRKSAAGGGRTRPLFSFLKFLAPSHSLDTCWSVSG